MSIKRPLFLSLGLLCFAGAARSQSNTLLCLPTAVPSLVRAEGISERLGDIVMECSGTPGTPISGSLTIFVSTTITNRIINSQRAIDALLTIDSGSGPQPQPPGILINNTSVTFVSISFTVPPSGKATLRLSHLRGDASTQVVDRAINVTLANANNISVPVTQLAVAYPTRSLLATYSSTGVRCVGSLLPSGTTMQDFFQKGTRFVSTRLTEGFPSAFAVKDPLSDTGSRIIVRYSGFPAGARLFVPDLVAGSDAATPTSGGDLGLPRAVGAYQPATPGSLLLSRVIQADSSGAGSVPAFVPPPPGTPTIELNAMGEVPLVNGSGYVVYEVVDANNEIRESVQFPTFVGLPPNTSGEGVLASQAVTLAPISSTPEAASPAVSVPRFVAVAPPTDCPILRDCDASYFPRLSINERPLRFTAFAGEAFRAEYVQINNIGGGLLNWTASISMKNGTGWATVNPTSGINNATVRAVVLPNKLTAGTYEGTLTIDAGPLAGSKTVPITLVVVNFPPPPFDPPKPKVIVDRVISLARPEQTVVSPGSLAAVRGTGFVGNQITASFDGVPATMLSTTPERIELLVPAGLGVKTSAQIIVTVDGANSESRTVELAEVAPAIFPNGVLNSDSTVNSPTNGAPVGSILQIFATGVLPASGGRVVAKVHDRYLTPLYAGAAPGLLGVNQINVAIPDDLPAMLTSALVCGYGAADPAFNACSYPASITLTERRE